MTAVEYALVASITAGLAIIAAQFMSDVLANVVVLVHGAIDRIR